MPKGRFFAFALSCLVLSWLASSTEGATDCYRATFDEVATGTTGYFDLSIDLDEATYDWSFDVTNLASSCASDEGLNIHIHAYWSESETSSTTCGGTGGHYDPTLGCTDATEMRDECTALQRTAAQGYVYECSPENFASGLHYQCEVGDIQAKFGTFYPDSTGVVFSGSVEDLFPPSAINFGNISAADGIATSWESIVFHCPSTGSRLWCAQFESVSCGGDSDDDNEETVDLTQLEFGLIVAGSIIGGSLLAVLLLIGILGFRKPVSTDGSSDKSVLMAGRNKA